MKNFGFVWQVVLTDILSKIATASNDFEKIQSKVVWMTTILGNFVNKS